MDKKPIGYQPGKSSVIDKRVPINPKYSHIESTLAGKTGTTIKDIEIVSKMRYNLGNKVVSNRKNELFKRMKPTTLAKLLLQDTKTESIYKLSECTIIDMQNPKATPKVRPHQRSLVSQSRLVSYQ
jgi:hypothetical protein